MSITKAAMGAAGKRFCTAFTTWFVVPDQGMKDLDILNRGTAFLVPSQSKKYPHKYHIVTASHIVAPWRWPGLYNDDFLQFITEKNTHYTLDMRHMDGTLMTQVDCKPRSYHHPKRDLAILHLENEDEHSEFIENLGLQILNLKPRPNRGEWLQFMGHEVINPNPFEDPDADGADIRLPYPKVVNGMLQGYTKHQTFCKTDTVLANGMCGGPVLFGKTETNNTCGMVEGIVPEDHTLEDLIGLAVFIEGEVISEFIDQVEADMVDEDDCLIGGEAAIHVGADQDPDKMGMESLRKLI